MLNRGLPFVLIAILTLLSGATAPKSLEPVRSACEWVESRKDATQVNEKEDAIGILQIRPKMVEDVNRIVGKPKYTNEDRRDIRLSRAMFDIYSRYWAEKKNDWTDDGIARRWNGGPTGHREASTLPYMRKVRIAIKQKR